MSILDVAIIILVAIGLIRGFATGLVRQVFGLAGFILAFVLALELMPFLAERFVGPVGVEGLAARVVAFLIILVVVLVVVGLIARLVERAAGVLHLTILNRVGGGLAGALKAALLTSVALVLLARVGIPAVETQRQSVLYGPTVMLVPTAWDLVAGVWPDVQTMSERFGDEVRSYWPEPGDPPDGEAQDGRSSL